MRPTIYLFDIDGTLLDGKGAGRAAMEAAFREIVGSDASLATFSFAGMTDPAIIRAGLVGAGVEPTTTTMADVLRRYLAHLPAAIARAESFSAHRGVDRVLSALESMADVALGLGTGNVESGARMKLRPIGLDHRFAFGGFGCDHEERAELLRIGAERGASQLRRSRESCRVVVIGDTPRDIEAAHAIEAECLAVATCFHDEAALAQHGPECVVASLEADAALAFLCV